MTSTNELSLVKSENFGAVQCDFWKNESNDYFMTRDQIGTALGYTDPRIAITKIHNRNRDRLDKFSVVTKLVSTDGKTYSTTVYSSKGVYEICRFSRQPKADAFMDWTWDIIDNLRTGNLQLSSGAVSMSPAVVNAQYENLVGKMQSLENILGAYGNRIDGMANAFLYIKKKLDGEDPFKDIKAQSKQKTWKQSAISRVKDLVLEDKSQKSVNMVLKQIYSRMRNVYGIVFDQELKEYRDKYNPDKKPSVLDLVNQKETLKSLFDSILSDISSGNNSEKTTSTIKQTPVDIIRESINPLIVKYGDKTIGGGRTYRKVYDNMGVCWNNRIKRYMHSHNLSREPSKFKLVEDNYTLRLLFLKTVNRLLEEN